MRRPPPPKQRAKRPVSARRRWTRRVLAALLLLLLLWWLWPEPEPAEVAAPPPPPAKAGPEKPPANAGKATVTVTPNKKPPPPAPFNAALLKAAILARSDDLNTCEMPPGSPPRLTTKIRIARSGPVRGVSFANADPIPTALSECVRRKMRDWTFADLKLPADVDVLVTFRLGGG